MWRVWLAFSLFNEAQAEQRWAMERLISEELEQVRKESGRSIIRVLPRNLPENTYRNITNLKRSSV
jgi:hypothetical protein